MNATDGYALKTRTSLTYDEAVSRTRAALAEEGFGVLTEIDMAGTLKQKLGIDRAPYIILGACNPPLAAQALEAETDIGLLLPCNVVVYTDDDAGHTVVAAIDPQPQLAVAGNPQIEPVAMEVREKLQRAIDAVAA